MYSVFLVALLAHLISDFLLLPDWLFLGKSKTPMGVLLHLCTMVLVTGTIFIWLLGVDTWPIILLSCALHIVVDLVKPFLLKFIKATNFTYFLMDQTIHFIILFMVANIGKNHVEPLGEDTLFLIRLGVMVLISTAFVTMLQKLAVISIYPKYYAKKPLFSKWERFSDGLFGLSIFVALYAIPFWFLSLPIILMFTGMYFFAANTYLKSPFPTILIKIIVSLLFVITFSSVLS